MFIFRHSTNFLGIKSKSDTVHFFNGQQVGVHVVLYGFLRVFFISFISSLKLRTPSVSPHLPEREVVVTQPPSSAAGGGRILFIHEGFPAI